MFNFTDIVSDVLLEQVNPSLPAWFNRILEKYDKLNFTDIKITNNDSVLSDIYTKVAGKPNVAQQDIRENIQFVGIYDLLRRLYTETTDKNKAKTWNDFKTQLVNGSNVSRYEQICNNDWSLIQNLTEENKSDWPIQNVQVKNAYDAATKEIANLGEKPLQGDTTLKNNNVIGAVQEIVNRRIGLFTRIGKLKNPKRPFNNLIQDIFKTPELYLSGSKKYSSDFEAIDELYIKDLINIALAAKNFYASEIAKLKLPQLETSSLNSFDCFVANILKEETPPWLQGPSAVQGQQQTPPQPTVDRAQLLRNMAQNRRAIRSSRYNEPPIQQQNPQNQQQLQRLQKQLYDVALDDISNRINFLAGKPVNYKLVDIQGKETEEQQTTDPKMYTVGNIMQNPSNEAKRLIEELGKIAQYTKKKAGAGERLKSFGQAASALMGFSGQSLYGGPR